MAVPFTQISNTAVDSSGVKKENESDEDDDLDLFDPDLEEKLKYAALEVRIFGNSGNGNNTEQQGPENVVVKPLLKNDLPVKICADDIPDITADSIPDYEELEDDFDISWRIKKEPSPESIHHELDALIHRGIKELSDDSGVDMLPGLSDVPGDKDSETVIYTRNETSPERPFCRLVHTSDNCKNSPSTNIIKTEFDEEDEEDTERMDLDSNEADGCYNKVKSEGLRKKTRPHPYLGKGKQGVTGASRIKTSIKQESRQSVPGQRLPTNLTPASDQSTPRLQEPVPPVECESCHKSHSHNNVVQCCDGHILCTSCVEKEAKQVIIGARKGSVKCAVVTCESSIPQSELRKSLPSIVLDLLEESWKKETLEALENMKDGVKCPSCGYSGVLDDSIKNFNCPRCKKMFCRLCEMEWHLKNHDLCIKQIKRVSEATGHTINIPAHWTLDTDTEEKVGFSVVELDPLSAEYLNVMGHFSQTQQQAFYKITKIYRVQNQRLWEKYSLLRTHMIQDIGEAHIDESRLFHGTQTEVIDSICKEGFDWRLCGKHGTVYGHGTYFAKEARYSTRYSSKFGGRWKPGAIEDPAQVAERRFPPSHTQFQRFNVLTGRPPSMPGISSGTVSSTAVKTDNSSTVMSSASRSEADRLKSVMRLSLSSSSFWLTDRSSGGAGSRHNLPGINSFETSRTGTDLGNMKAAITTTRSSGFDFGNTTPVTSAQSSPITTYNGFGLCGQSSNRSGFAGRPPVGLGLSGQPLFGSGLSGPGLSGQPSMGFGLFGQPLVGSGLSGQPSVGSGLSGQPLMGIGLFGQQSVNPNPFLNRDIAQSSVGEAAKLKTFSYLFLARVLVGRKCLGRPDMKRPDKDTQGSQCHTAVDSMDSSKIFVVFESGQCYPEYLIEYSKKIVRVIHPK